MPSLREGALAKGGTLAQPKGDPLHKGGLKDSYGFLKNLRDSSGFLRILTDSLGFLWIPEYS